ncbi:MAG: preprotein translocase subunit SecY [Candidatus Caenarcaniphilales bacterium]|nr:preprotein translocase subunit SecY [Candidatus Caenarcaniphilales bacterium]
MSNLTKSKFQKGSQKTTSVSSQIPSWDSFVQTGLLQRVSMTIGLLAFYRLGVQIPLSGINHDMMSKAGNLLSSNLLGLVDLFAGGALSNLSVFALGIGPYITASIMMQLLNEVFPQLKALQQEQGESGRKEYQQWVRRLSILLAIIQSFALTRWLYLSGLASPEEAAWLFYLKSIISLAAGSAFVMWIGELISEFGIGNGGSLLIFAGIAARLPQMFGQTLQAWESGTTPTWGLITLIVFFALIVLAIIYIQEGSRKLLIVGARSNMGGGGSSSFPMSSYANVSGHYLPLKVNPAGVLPLIFASATMYMPLQLFTFATGQPNLSISASFRKIFVEGEFFGNIFAPILSVNPINKIFEALGGFCDRLFAYSTWEHSLFYISLIILFAFFYASILLNPKDMAENLQKGGNAIQGIKPGKPTAEYIEKVLNRIVFIGACLIGLITILPIHVEKLCEVTTLGALGGTSLIIMVGVAIDLHTQIIAYTQAHQYQVRTLLSK